jgi:hypothetical protein
MPMYPRSALGSNQPAAVWVQLPVPAYLQAEPPARFAACRVPGGSHQLH